MLSFLFPSDALIFSFAISLFAAWNIHTVAFFPYFLLSSCCSICSFIVSAVNVRCK